MSPPRGCRRGGLRSGSWRRSMRLCTTRRHPALAQDNHLRAASLRALLVCGANRIESCRPGPAATVDRRSVPESVPPRDLPCFGGSSALGRSAGRGPSVSSSDRFRSTRPSRTSDVGRTIGHACRRVRRPWCPCHPPPASWFDALDTRPARFRSPVAASVRLDLVPLLPPRRRPPQRL